MKCVIFGAGSEFSEKIILPDEKCFIIAADGGLNKLNTLGIKPDHIVGDLDSLDKAPDGEDFASSGHLYIVRVPNATDAQRRDIITELAERYGIMSIPALFAFKNGEVAANTLGFKPEAALERIVLQAK